MSKDKKEKKEAPLFLETTREHAVKSHPKSTMWAVLDNLRKDPYKKSPIGLAYEKTGILDQYFAYSLIAVVYYTFLEEVECRLRNPEIPATRSLQQVTTNINLLLRGVPAEETSGIVQTAIWTGHALLWWELRGKPVYEVSDELAWVFLNTIIEDIPSNYIQVPYSTLVILLKNLAPVTYKGRVTTFTEAIVTYEEDTNYATLRLQLQALAEGYHFTELIKVDLRDDTVGECFEKALKDFREDNLSAFGPTLKRIFYFCINVILYATSKDSDDVLTATSLEYLKLKERAIKAKGPAKKRFQQQLATVHPKYRNILGAKTIIDRKREKIATEDGINKGVQRAHLVAGHWHHYWTGEGRTILIRKLLKPYWKGIPTAEESNQTRRYLAR